MKINEIVLMMISLCFISCASQNNSAKSEKSSEVKPEYEIVMSEDLCDKNATPNAKVLYAYLQKNYGKKVITGQMENAWDDNYKQLNQVYEKTEKYPAMMGFDFMNYTGVNTWRPSKIQTERAIEFWYGYDYYGNKISDNHGIVSFMWHWFAPTKTKKENGSFKPEETAFRIPYDTENDCWKEDSEDYIKMMMDMDVVAFELLKLQKEGVPVLWRPFHEAAGNLYGKWAGACAWFWWGAGNTTVYNEATKKYSVSTDKENCAECFIALWKLMYTYFTEEKGIHNLIWVWNGQSEDFYPGSEYVDIIGNDIYDNPGVHNSNIAKFVTYKAIDETKIVALTECGSMPDIVSHGALWSYFMVWNDSKRNTDDSNFWNGNKHNQDEYKVQLYTSPMAITLDELDDLHFICICH